MPADQQRSVVKFVTGTSRVPVGGFEPPFTIARDACARECPQLALPSSHTCFHTLVLPEYASLGRLAEKLLLAAMEHGEGFHLT